MRTRVLGPWEEAVGILRGVDYEMVRFEGFKVVAPGLRPGSLQDFIGRRIGVLRTEEDYRTRVIED